MRITNGRLRAGLPAAALGLLLAGCQTPPADRPLTSEVPEPPSFVTPPETCQATAVRFGLGLRISQQLLEEMRQRSGARVARTVLATETADPAQDMTRLNVQVEPTGRVVGAYCG
ncbi:MULTISPECIES: hypothetical protein [Variovorax]|jgi:hypothetical protein|uniref:hypothetical protein n=1 Tax=Variovorax TaxID=34072 RepID=UPI0008D07CA2|nr:hypothetical protein [Variovorax sp. OV084]SES85499.1 hypothetical protein SAMN05443580_101594 [Variovorax sp. OV084]